MNEYNIICIRLFFMEDTYMKKIVKKFAVAILLAMMTVIMIPFSVAAEEDTYTVYVDVPDSWGTPNIWAWTDSNVNVFDNWPGEPMEDAGDGLYVAELPKTALNILFNYKGDEHKTRDIKVTGQNCKIVINDNLNISIEYLAEEEEETTTVVEEEETTTEQATVNNTTSNNSNNKGGFGPETGIIVGAVVVVVLIVVAIFIVVFKKS